MNKAIEAIMREGEQKHIRTRLRLEQDFLIMLVADMSHFDENLPLTEGAPTCKQMRQYVYPEWESTILSSINTWAKEHNVGVPNFNHLAEVSA